MPKKRDKKPIVKMLWGAIDQAAQDRSFKDRFSDARMLGHWEDMYAWLVGRDWNYSPETGPGAGWTRNGVVLLSEDGLKVGRNENAAYRAWQLCEDLSNLLRTADPQAIRALRIAFEAGSTIVESWAYHEKAKSGRKNLNTQTDAMFRAAYKTFRGKHSATPNKPRWKDIQDFVIPGQRKASARQLENLFSKWWAKNFSGKQ